MSDETDQTCQHCKRVTHPAYMARYGGFCLDCDNAGVPALLEQLDGTQGELAQAQKRETELRAALQEIARGHDDYQSFSGTMCADIARAALAAK